MKFETSQYGWKLTHLVPLCLKDVQPVAGTHRQWIPVLPVGELAALPGPNGRRRTVEVQEDMIKAAVSEMKRYHADLEAMGSQFRRPIIAEHDVDRFKVELGEDGTPVNARPDKNGRKSGKILDYAVRPYDHKLRRKVGPDSRDTLFLLAEWNENAWQAIQAGELEHVSVHLLPHYVDPQTGKEYGPFVFELSETVIPVVKDFDLNELEPSVLDGLGLRLADEPQTQNGDEMTPEELAAALEAALTPTNERLDALGAGIAKLLEGVPAAEDEDDSVEASDTDPQPEPQDPQPAPTPAVQLSDFQKMLEEEREARKKEHDALILRLSAGGNTTNPGGSGAPPKPANKVDASEALVLAEKELGDGADFMDVVKRAKQIELGN